MSENRFMEGTEEPQQLTHLTDQGEVHMVDVGGKAVTRRTARACAEIAARPETLVAIQSGATAKGDVLAVARVAGIMAAKHTADLIPLCHQIALTSVDVTVEFAGDDHIRIITTANAAGQTGVEMEALMAASIAALTIYDMCKSIDRGMTITGVKLLAKAGGKSGTWQSAEPS